MSTDVYVGDESVNFTYNYQPLFEHVGVKSITVLEDMVAGIAVYVVKELLVRIMGMSGEECHLLIRGGGEWGTKTTCLNSLYKLMIACENHKDERIKTL